MLERFKREVYSWSIVILVVLVLRAIFVEAYVIPTGSMERTLLIGDALLVNRFIYGVKFPYTQIQLVPGRLPQRGEIIVFKYPYENRDYVKRCVAIAGDTIRVIDKVLYVNGRQVEEPYKWHRDRTILPGFPSNGPAYQKNWEEAKFADIYGIYARDNFGPVVVPADYVFAMGDNRDNSLDSRFWGPLHKRFLKGKPLFIYFSFDPGHEAQNLFDILRFWQWKSIRLGRVGRIV
jgi:signal peptidase I